jgi:hypothetical protein
VAVRLLAASEEPIVQISVFSATALVGSPVTSSLLHQLPVLAEPVDPVCGFEWRLSPNFNCSEPHEHMAAFRKSQVATERLHRGRYLNVRFWQKTN